MEKSDLTKPSAFRPAADFFRKLFAKLSARRALSFSPRRAFASRQRKFPHPECSRRSDLRRSSFEPAGRPLLRKPRPLPCCGRICASTTGSCRGEPRSRQDQPDSPSTGRRVGLDGVCKLVRGQEDRFAGLPDRFGGGVKAESIRASAAKDSRALARGIFVFGVLLPELGAKFADAARVGSDSLPREQNFLFAGLQGAVLQFREPGA